MSAPYFPFYPADFIADTVDLTPGEVGTYLRLLCFQWKKGSVPDDTKTIMRIAGCTEAEANAVRTYFERICERNANAYADEMREVYVLVNPRLKQEFDQMVEKSSKASESAKKRWKHSSSAYDDANAMRTHMPTHSEGISERNAIQISDIRDNSLSLSPVRAHTHEAQEVQILPRMQPLSPGDAAVPTLELVRDYANMKGFDASVADLYFNIRERDDWQIPGNSGTMRPIANWRADFNLKARELREQLTKQPFAARATQLPAPSFAGPNLNMIEAQTDRLFNNSLSEATEQAS